MIIKLPEDKDLIVLDQDVVFEKNDKIILDLSKLPDNREVIFEYDYRTNEWKEVIE